MATISAKPIWGNPSIAQVSRDPSGSTMFAGRHRPEPDGPFQVLARFQVDSKLQVLGPGAALKPGWCVDSEQGLYCEGRCVGTFVEAQVDMDHSMPWIGELASTPSIKPRLTYSTTISAVLDFDLYTE